MDVQSCIDIYSNVSEKLFRENPRLLGKYSKFYDMYKGKPLFDASKLEEEVKRMVRQKFGDGNEDTALFDPQGKCKV